MQCLAKRYWPFYFISLIIPELESFHKRNNSSSPKLRKAQCRLRAGSISFKLSNRCGVQTRPHQGTQHRLSVYHSLPLLAFSPSIHLVYRAVYPINNEYTAICRSLKLEISSLTGLRLRIFPTRRTGSRSMLVVSLSNMMLRKV